MKQCRFRSLPELSQGAKISHPAFALFCPFDFRFTHFFFVIFPFLPSYIMGIEDTFVFLLTLSTI